jgi:NAD(P)-dependent dehydrogenase (short-subunit alcohol dehydrogenase family)
MSQDRSRVAVVTGASSGIGKEAAKALAAQGWHVIAHGRDPDRSAEAEQEIRSAAAPGARVDMVRGDLCLLSDTARMADEIATLASQVDVLLNNAGGVRSEKVITSEGNEVTFAGNHLGHFLLTQRLLPLLRTAATNSDPGSVRIVNVSSRGHMMCQAIDWDDLQQKREWVSVNAYALAKLSNILFARELARRLEPEGIVAHSMHPGVVASNFANHGTVELQSHMAAADADTAETGADTLIWLATAAEPGHQTGRYYFQRKEQEPSSLALDASVAQRVWMESEALVAKAGF